MNLGYFRVIADQVSTGAAGVSKTAVLNLAKKTFTDLSTGATVTAIEQNPATGSYWARLAKEGHQVIQFKQGDKYVAVSVDGKVMPYGTGRSSK